MDIKKMVLQMRNFHTEDLEDSLDEDERRAQYIKNPFLKTIYLLLFNVSMYMIALFFVYFSLTGQLGHLNLFSFLNKTRHIFHAILTVILLLIVKGIRDYVMPKTDNLATRKKLNIVLDFLRFVTYTTIYFFIVWVLIGKKKQIQLHHSKYMMFVMLILFIARKILFWLIFIFKDDE